MRFKALHKKSKYSLRCEIISVMETDCFTLSLSGNPSTTSFGLETPPSTVEQNLEHKI